MKRKVDILQSKLHPSPTLDIEKGLVLLEVTIGWYQENASSASSETKWCWRYKRIYTLHSYLIHCLITDCPACCSHKKRSLLFWHSWVSLEAGFKQLFYRSGFFLLSFKHFALLGVCICSWTGDDSKEKNGKKENMRTATFSFALSWSGYPIIKVTVPCCWAEELQQKTEPASFPVTKVKDSSAMWLVPAQCYVSWGQIWHGWQQCKFVW